MRTAECSCHYGNVALETLLFAELFCSLAVEWGVAVCSDASLMSAYYLTERTGHRVRSVTKSKACCAVALGDISESILKFPVVDKSLLAWLPHPQLLTICDAVNTLECDKNCVIPQMK